MKILVLTNYYPPAHVGGYELACQQTVNWLRQQGHQVRVLCGDWQAQSLPTETDVLRRLQLIDYKKPSYQQKWQTERQNYELTRQEILSWNPDLVYIWSQRLVSLGLLWAVQDLKCKRVFEIGDFWPDSYLKPGLKAWAKRQFKQFVPGLLGGPVQIDPVISVSQWMIPEIKAKYGTQQIQCVPNGIPLPKQSQANWEQPIKALFVGRLDPEKGLHLALEALADLKARGIVLPLSIVGQGDLEYTRHCRELAQQLGLEQQLTWCGWQQNLDAIYSEHQLLLMPTLMREPFGLVVIEAMMRGLVVFASDAYGPAEIIQSGQTGYLFAPDSSQNLAECLAMALKNLSDLWLIGQAAALESRRTYALDRVKKQVEQILYQQAGVTPCQII